MKKHQIFAALALLLALGFAVPSLLGLPAEANESTSPTINTDHLTNLSEVAPEANAPGAETAPISDPDDSSANSPDSETTEQLDFSQINAQGNDERIKHKRASDRHVAGEEQISNHVV